ncbi:MAG: beta-ketoacyl synthase N-terminal-like domain-containing protein [Alcaligenaceae bacterium]
MSRIVITGIGAICGAGTDAGGIVETLLAGRSALVPITSFNAEQFQGCFAAEVPDYNGGKLLGDRKLLKLVRRSDVFGIYAGSQAIEQAGLPAWREALDEVAAAHYADQTGCYVGSGAGAFEVNYDYFPLMAETKNDLNAFGRELSNMVNPMWLLKSLPNNVLCHISIRHQLKGPNGCITNHTSSGILSVIESAWALREGDAERVVAVDLDRVGLIGKDSLRPFDQRHDGCLLGEGAASLVLETEASAQERGATILGEYLGGGDASEGEGLFCIRSDGDGLSRAIELALADAQLTPADVGMIVAHGNGTQESDASEAAAFLRVFGADMPPVTGFKWSAGHLFAASGLLDVAVGLEACRRKVVPGIATLERLAESCEGLNVSKQTRAPRSDVVLVVCRGFAGTNGALLLRAIA